MSAGRTRSAGRWWTVAVGVGAGTCDDLAGWQVPAAQQDGMDLLLPEQAFEADGGILCRWGGGGGGVRLRRSLGDKTEGRWRSGEEELDIFALVNWRDSVIL